MNRDDALEAVEDSIGYSFSDRALLDTALTHSSYRNEARDSVDDNERLEFLGDAVVNLVIAARSFLLEPDADEGRMTRLKARVVCRDALARRGRALGLGDCLLLGRGADSEDRAGASDSVLSNVFEAVVGAMFLDAGYKRAGIFVTGQLGPLLEECIDNGHLVDAKSSLQAFCLRTSEETPQYSVQATEGPSHAPLFTVRVSLPDGHSFQGMGRSKKDAEQAAAEEALKRVCDAHEQPGVK